MFFGNIQLAYLFTIMFHMVPSITEKITTNTKWAGGGFDEFLNLMNFLVFLIL